MIMGDEAGMRNVSPFRVVISSVMAWRTFQSRVSARSHLGIYNNIICTPCKSISLKVHLLQIAELHVLLQVLWQHQAT